MSWTSFTRSLGILAALVGLVCWLNDWWLGAAAATVLPAVVRGHPLKDAHHPGGLSVAAASQAKTRRSPPRRPAFARRGGAALERPPRRILALGTDRFA